MAHSRLYVSGILVADENKPIRESFAAMLQCLDANSSRDTLVENVNIICDEFIEHCRDERENYSGPTRGSYTRMITTVEIIRDRLVQYAGNRDVFDRIRCQTILIFEGLGELRGFGVANKFGDPLIGNPEKISVLKAGGY